jgi:hypothetical protein
MQRIIATVIVGLLSWILLCVWYFVIRPGLLNISLLEERNAESSTSKSASNEDMKIHYKRIHQRLNDDEWKETETPDKTSKEKFNFEVYHRDYSPTSHRPSEKVIKVHSECLKGFLSFCFPSVDALLDVNPEVRRRVTILKLD